jgi:hypothetical protein
VTEKIETFVRGLRPLLLEIRKAQAEIMADPRAKVSAARLDRWAEAIEAFLENVGEGRLGGGTIALEELNSETISPGRLACSAI